MKHIYVLIVVFLFNSVTYCQDQLIGLVKYQKIIHTTNNGLIIALPYELCFDLDTSSFYQVGSVKPLTDDMLKESVNEKGENVSMTLVKSNNPWPFYYTNIPTKELIFRESVAKKLYVIQDSIEVINWKLHTDTKKIGSYDCQKATGFYRGREYTVWFTQEIPVSHGPWKLRGLPGLILEATESTGKYEFRATKILLNPKSKQEVLTKLEKPTEKADDMSVYISAVKTEYEDTNKAVLATMPRGGKIRECNDCPESKNRTIEIYK